MDFESSRMDDFTISAVVCPLRSGLSLLRGENHDPPRGSLPSARGARTELASAPRLRDQRVRVAVSGKKDGHKPVNSRSAGQTVPVWLSSWEQCAGQCSRSVSSVWVS